MSAVGHLPRCQCGLERRGKIVNIWKDWPYDLQWALKNRRPTDSGNRIAHDLFLK
jgi:hypothetical protein